MPAVYTALIMVLARPLAIVIAWLAGWVLPATPPVKAQNLVVSATAMYVTFHVRKSVFHVMGPMKLAGRMFDGWFVCV
jgi:hypothetical protein